MRADDGFELVLKGKPELGGLLLPNLVACCSPAKSDYRLMGKKKTIGWQKVIH